MKIPCPKCGSEITVNPAEAASRARWKGKSELSKRRHAAKMACARWAHHKNPDKVSVDSKPLS